MGGEEGGRFFQGKSQEKILLCKGGHFLKNNNIGVCVLSTRPDQQKRPQCKNAQKMQKKYQTLKNFSSLVSLSRILQNSYFWSSSPPCPSSICKIVFFFFFFFFFLSKQST